MVSGDSTTNLSSLGGSMMGSSADLAGLEISDKAGKKATKVPKKNLRTPPTCNPTIPAISPSAPDRASHPSES
ncbi:hypothetical protein T492DRAFT_900990 [Pavlovales sp. CCMP2436]|nr:hypothetical protein T492DRAFT_900990 [Pavlovales sp. CCMP2436]